MENILIDKRYKIIKKIGEGGSSVVYKCFDNIGDEYVAIKLLKGIINEVTYEKNKYRLMKEAQFLSYFKSKNIISLKKCCFLDDRNSYIVLEYVDGVTLKEFIKSRNIGTLESLHIMLEIIKGLLEIHNYKLIHRDIKSQNVIIDNVKNVKLLDFGIMLGQNNNFHLTSENKVIGSILYMAPEILSKTQSFSRQSDIYSLGIIFFELLTGELPFTANSIDLIAEKHVSKIIPHLKLADKALSIKLQKIINNACAKYPENRYKDLSLMYNDIKKIYSDLKYNKTNSKNKKIRFWKW